MEMPIQSVFWYVSIACLGGVFVCVGLIVEAFSEKDWFNNIKSRRRWKFSNFWFGELFVIFGIVIEVVVAYLTAREAWQSEPLNAPINSISAVLKLKISGAHSEMFKYPGLGTFELPGPDSVLPQSGWLVLIEGTNTAKAVYSLRCGESDIQALGSGLVGGSNDWRGLVIKFHEEGDFNELDMRGSFASNNFVNGTPVKKLNEVGGLVISLPLMATNLYVHSGTVEVKVNSLRWQFPIPAQRPYLGYMTSQVIVDAKKRIDSKVLPIRVADWAVPRRFPDHEYDGK
jgi:hypothetical protein